MHGLRENAASLAGWPICVMQGRVSIRRQFLFASGLRVDKPRLPIACPPSSLSKEEFGLLHAGGGVFKKGGGRAIEI